MNSSKIAVALAASLFLVNASAQDKGGPSDPQIAGIVVAADQIGHRRRQACQVPHQEQTRCRSSPSS